MPRVHLVLLLTILLVQGEKLPLRCPKGVARLSASQSLAHFYQCDSDRQAVLSQCPPGHTYRGLTQTCHHATETEDPKPFDDKALGRKVVLGALYNGRKNEFYVSRSLWLDTTIRNHKFTYDRKETTTSFTADTRQVDKVDKFDISANLKLDFLSGAVKVEGAMEYLTDEVSSEKELNVEMMYHTTKYAETMPKYAPKDYPEECNNKDITHVVTSVTYGMDANFIFKYLLAEHESKESIYGMLKITVTSIPGLAIHGSGEVNLTSAQVDMMTRTDISVFGDFDSSGHTIPTDFDSACQLYMELPGLSGTASNGYRGTTILDVHLTPITDICTEADYILNDINEGLIASITTMLSELELIEVKVSGLGLRPPSKQFRPIMDNLNTFDVQLKRDVGDIKNNLRDIIPNIRGGTGHGEEELAQLLMEYEESMFAYETSNQFLINRNREISAVVYLMDTFPTDNEGGDGNIQIMDWKTANDVNVFLKWPKVIVLELQILTPPSLTNNFLNGHPEDEDGFWFNDIEMNGHIGSLLRNLSLFAWENDNSKEVGYLVKLEELDSGNPVMMMAVNDGIIVTEMFEVPSSPEKPSIYHISHDSVKLKVKKFNEFTTGVNIYATKAFDEEEIVEKLKVMFPSDLRPGEEMEITADNLEAVTLYTISVKYFTEYGLSPPSPASTKFITAPSSPPESLTVTTATSNTLTVTWAEPTSLGTVGGVMISPGQLCYSIYLYGLNGYSDSKVFHYPAYETIFGGLQDASNYVIEARTFWQDGTEDPGDREETTTVQPSNNYTGLYTPLIMISTSLPATIASYSSPLTPQMLPPLPGEVDLTSVTARWESPLRLPEEATEIYYTLAYSTLSDDGSLGELTEVNVNEEMAVIGGLTKGTLYGFKAKIVTNVGESAYSDILAVKTKTDLSDLGQFEDEVMDTLEGLKKEAKLKSTFCASRATWDKVGRITFDDLFVSRNNIVNAAMDAATGKFKAGAAGSYMVSVSLEMKLNPGQQHKIWIQKLGNSLPETLMSSSCNILQFYGMSDNGSKDVVLDLEEGDELNLFHTTGENGQGLANLVFCVQSLKVH